jgi:methyl-accepting chemotaxis protein
MSKQAKHEIQGGILSIRSRVALSVTAPLLILLLVSVMSLWALINGSEALGNLNDSSIQTQKTTQIKDTLQDEIITPLYNIRSASLTPVLGLSRLKFDRTDFDKEWDTYISSLGKSNPDTVAEMARGKRFLDQGLDKLFNVLARTKPDDLSEFIKASSYFVVKESSGMGFVFDDISGLASTLNNALKDQINKNRLSNQQVYNESKHNIDLSTSTIATVILLGLIFILVSGILLYSSIARPIDHLRKVVNQLARGDLGTRSRLRGNDELSRLGDAFNSMMDERSALKSRVDKDNEAINHSVFSLLEAVSDLSDRNLTVRAIVTEDATGPLADAINQLAEDTTEVLNRVKEIAASVQETAESVNQRSQSVSQLALEEHAEATETANQIEHIRKRLASIASAATQTNEVAGVTSNRTQNAFQSVSRSMSSMTDIRNTVQDTGKRIKRLGERSQEISYITDIINGIAERTTVLALNANMQAMAAGDAGKGFSVIADEIQRLAESSRESTSQISTLVKNIQQETKSTIATMDHTIEQVVEGSGLADEATRQMQETLEATNQLTASVNDIASASHEQMEMSHTLQARATRIVETTTATGKEMVVLTELTGDMSDYAKQLVDSVNVFKLEA